MEQQILKDYSDREKGAYLGAIASLATADHAASEEELQALDALSDAAALTDEQRTAVRQAATEISGDELARCLAILRESELRFSLVADLIAFAEADGSYSPEEKAAIERISAELEVNREQFSLLDQFVQESKNHEPDQQANVQPAMDRSGLGDRMQRAGINSGGLLKGLLGMAGPMILAGLVTRGMGRRGGMMGGMGRMGGFGSLIGMMSGGRGYRRSGGLLGRMMGRW